MPAASRAAAVAGSWYPGDARRLAQDVERHLAAAAPAREAGRLLALLSPHAGLRYSGPVAAWGYALLRAAPPSTIVMVGPSHRVAFAGASVWTQGAWDTPLGAMPIDEALAARLAASAPGLAGDRHPHLSEHSLEMQLPFLKVVAPQARLVPVLMGDQSRAAVDVLAGALVSVLAGVDALLVASSDLSHYEPAPRANTLDAQVADDVRGLDPEGLMARLERDPGHACGGGPMVAVMKAARARGATRATVLRYADSGDVAEGDKSRVVGYLSAALWAEPA
jgi:MEMO1 family protein